MRNLTLSVLALLIYTTCLFAQVKSKLKNIQEETIITTIVTKGVNEETSVTKTVIKENQVIEIKDTGVENQNEVYSSVKSSATNETIGTVTVNKENEAALKELKKAQEKEIEDYKKAQLLKYEAERKVMEEKRPEKFKKNDNSSDN